MKISTRARYGVRAMLDLAIHYEAGPVLVKDIARRQQISGKYLEQILITLKLVGLVRSIRGMHGGFLLAKPPAAIKLSDIVRALDGSLAPVECVDDPELYPRSSFCAAHELWKEVNRAVCGVLESVTLKDFVERQLKKEAEAKVRGLYYDEMAETKKCGE